MTRRSEPCAKVADADHKRNPRRLSLFTTMSIAMGIKFIAILTNTITITTRIPEKSFPTSIRTISMFAKMGSGDECG
ncbi:hypothetical protein JCM31598_09950 [Desulfonatronum parangueonense]